MSLVLVCRAAMLALLIVATACTDSTPPTMPTTPTVPTGVPPPAPGPTPAPTPFPGPGIYEFRASPGVLVSPYTAASRYVIRGDGTFVLQFPTLPNFEVQGKYREADGRIIFDFDWNAQQAGATGVFSESEMTVTYNGYMSMSDFENGVYVKTP